MLEEPFHPRPGRATKKRATKRPIFDLGKKLRVLSRFAQEKGLGGATREELANIIGCPVSECSKMLNGNQEIKKLPPGFGGMTDKQQKRLAVHFKFDVDGVGWCDGSTARKQRRDSAAHFERELRLRWEAPHAFVSVPRTGWRSLFSAEGSVTKRSDSYALEAWLSFGLGRLTDVGVLGVRRGTLQVQSTPRVGSSSQATAARASSIYILNEEGEVRFRGEHCWDIESRSDAPLQGNVDLEAPWCELPLSTEGATLRFFIQTDEEDLCIRPSERNMERVDLLIARAEAIRLVREKCSRDLIPQDAELTLYEVRFARGDLDE